MEISGVSSINSVQTCVTQGMQQSSSVSMIIIDKDDDEDKKKFAMLTICNQSMQGIASQYYRDSVGRPALGSYNNMGEITGSLNTIGTNLNIEV